VAGAGGAGAVIAGQATWLPLQGGGRIGHGAPGGQHGTGAIGATGAIAVVEVAPAVPAGGDPWATRGQHEASAPPSGQGVGRQVEGPQQTMIAGSAALVPGALVVVVEPWAGTGVRQGGGTGVGHGDVVEPWAGTGVGQGGGTGVGHGDVVAPGAVTGVRQAGGTGVGHGALAAPAGGLQNTGGPGEVVGRPPGAGPVGGGTGGGTGRGPGDDTAVVAVPVVVGVVADAVGIAGIIGAAPAPGALRADSSVVALPPDGLRARLSPTARATTIRRAAPIASPRRSLRMLTILRRPARMIGSRDLTASNRRPAAAASHGLRRSRRRCGWSCR
jgi:hypothetical protein